MLVLGSLQALLTQLVSPPSLHTAIILTPQGHLIAYNSSASPPLSEDNLRIIVGLSGEVWREGVRGKNEEDVAIAECDLGRILVVPVWPPNHSSASGSSSDGTASTSTASTAASTPAPQFVPAHMLPHGIQQPPRRPEPLLLIALHATPETSWGMMRMKAKTLANHLAEPVGVVGSRLVTGSAAAVHRAPTMRSYS
jgi:hypothetical protein